MIVDPIVMWNVRKPSNLPDYMSLCYGISDYEDQNGSVSKKDWKNSCHYGVIDDEARVPLKCLPNDSANGINLVSAEPRLKVIVFV